MKKLMTIVIAIVIIAGFTSTTNAQISAGVKAGIALPMGDFGDGFGLGFGASAIGEYALNENMAVGLNIGYYAFSGKDLPDGYKRTMGFVPILADFKYFFMKEGFMPYVGLGLGLYMSTFSYTNPSYTLLGVTIPESTGSESETNFGFVPKVGFWMGESFKYGASIEYNIVSVKFGAPESSSAAHLGINVGFLYAFGK